MKEERKWQALVPPAKRIPLELANTVAGFERGVGWVLI
jgi:hypothetical protein